MNGAEQLIRAAIDQGISVCFANPGTSEMHVVAAIDSINEKTNNVMRPVLGLHETVCSGAADGYARMSHKPALTLLHLGPGLANAIANMHNARRASTPMINIIGDMATWHKDADPLLNMDIASLASTVSRTVLSCGAHRDNPSRRSLYQTMVQAHEETQHGFPGDSRIVTVIVPHDLAWTKENGSIDTVVKSGARDNQDVPFTTTHSIQKFVDDCAAALKQCPRGKLAIYVGGTTSSCTSSIGVEKNSKTLDCVGRIASALGAQLYCENAFSRVDRGAGLPSFQRLPYFPQEAAAELRKYYTVLLIDARKPVANFGYENGPSKLLSNIPEARVWEIDSCIEQVVDMLCHAVGGHCIKPMLNCGGIFAQPLRPHLTKHSSGRLTASSLCHIIAALQPEHAIIVDESLTSGQSYWEASKGCPPFSHLTLTGGAIGAGIPLAVGAAIACPDRKVIALQADGSAMYSVQGLWTQAKEGLDVVTVICSNRAYAILKLEMAKQAITPNNGAAAKALTDISSIDWINLAKGLGVQAACRVNTCDAFVEAFKNALQRPGPSLIEAMLG